MVDKCNVVIIARDSRFLTVPNQVIEFRRASPVPVGLLTSVLLPSLVTITLDGNGEGAVDLVPGVHQGVTLTSEGRQVFRVSVPDLATEFLHNLIGRPDVESITAAQLAATAAAADRVQTGLDRVATGVDRTATAADRVQTGLDRTATGADRSATSADRVQTGLDRTATAADRVQTGLDRTATDADRTQTGLDRAAIENALFVYISDDATSVTLAVGHLMVVTESALPYPSVTLEIST